MEEWLVKEATSFLQSDSIYLIEYHLNDEYHHYLSYDLYHALDFAFQTNWIKKTIDLTIYNTLYQVHRYIIEKDTLTVNNHSIFYGSQAINHYSLINTYIVQRRLLGLSSSFTHSTPHELLQELELFETKDINIARGISIFQKVLENLCGDSIYIVYRSETPREVYSINTDFSKVFIWLKQIFGRGGLLDNRYLIRVYNMRLMKVTCEVSVYSADVACISIINQEGKLYEKELHDIQNYCSNNGYKTIVNISS